MVKVFIIINLFLFATSKYIRYDWTDEGGNSNTRQRLVFNQDERIMVSKTRNCIADNEVMLGANCLTLRRVLKGQNGGSLYTHWFLFENGDLVMRHLGQSEVKKCSWCEEDGTDRAVFAPNPDDLRECPLIEETPGGECVHAIRVDFMRKKTERFFVDEEEAIIRFCFDADGLLVSVDRY